MKLYGTYSKKTIRYQIEKNIYDSEVQTSIALTNMVKENEASLNFKIYSISISFNKYC